MNTSPIVGVTESIAAEWLRVGRRAPRLAMRRAVLSVCFALLAVPGLIHLHTLWLWSFRTHQPLLLATIIPHVVAVVLAVGMPVRVNVPTRLRGLVGRFMSREARLRALRRTIAIEVALLWLAPPVLTLVADRKLQWGASAVVALTMLTIVWAFERVARAQSAAAGRIAEVAATDVE